MNCLLFLSYVGNRTKIRCKAASKPWRLKKIVYKEKKTNATPSEQISASNTCIALAICEEALLYPLCFTCFTALLPSQQGFRFHIFFERLPSRRRMFLKTTLLHSHFNVLHGTFAFFILYLKKGLFSSYTDTWDSSFLMEVSIVRISSPLQGRKGEVEGKNKNNRKKYSFFKSAFYLTVP